MSTPLEIAFFGSSLVSAYWNGAATYYRGILRGLSSRGHRIRFFEPDVLDRQRHRDIPDPPWAEVNVYAADSEASVAAALQRAAGSDVLVKTSGVGAFDEWLDEHALTLQSARTRVIYWDVDAPATLERLHAHPQDPLRALLPRYDAVFTYGGGDPVVSAYIGLGARRCVPVYNALDPTTHHPAPPDERFRGELGFLANRLPDREARVEEFFFGAAARLPAWRFVLGGSGWESRPMPPNVRYVGHVYTGDHNAFNASVRAVLNVHRDSMARMGYSPATRLFEAAGAEACIITDPFAGIEQFLAPGREILVAQDGADVAACLQTLSESTARTIGRRARIRVSARHTYGHRAVEVEKALVALRAGGDRIARPADTASTAADTLATKTQAIP